MANYLNYACDLETTTDPNDTRVWGSACYGVESNKLEFIGNDLDSMMMWFSTRRLSHNAYFHNLKFDGQFIISWLLKNGYTLNLNGDNLQEKEFSVLIVELGAFYKIDICHQVTIKTIKHRNGSTSTKTSKVQTFIKDSLKKISVPISAMPKMFKFEDIAIKGEIDYNKVRPLGYVMDDEEREYLINDVKILAMSLASLFRQGLTKLTSSSDALHEFKVLMNGGETKGKEQTFRRMFPLLDKSLDDYIRKSYKGGYTYLRDDRANIRYKEGLTYDVNSLYPSAMYDNLLPFGQPKPVQGRVELEEGSIYKLFIQRFTCTFKVKEGHLPMIQLKGNMRYLDTEYLKESKGVETLTLTNVDMEIFFKHYHVKVIEWIDGLMFRASRDIFKEYIDKWSYVKIHATDPGERQASKLMLNSLYGKLASSTESKLKFPYLGEDGRVRYKVYQEWKDKAERSHYYEIGHEPKGMTIGYRDSVYTACASFITAYARKVTIESAQEYYDRFIYCDTDSIHLIGFDEPTELDIHDSRLGAWKLEGRFIDSVFLRAKTYIEHYEGHEQFEVKCAGMPDRCKALVTDIEQFKSGAQFPGKLVPKVVDGGVVLVETTFTIK